MLDKIADDRIIIWVYFSIENDHSVNYVRTTPKLGSYFIELNVTRTRGIWSQKTDIIFFLANVEEIGDSSG